MILLISVTTVAGKPAPLGVLVDQLRVVADVDAEGLVAGYVAVLPLDGFALGLHRLQN